MRIAGSIAACAAEPGTRISRPTILWVYRRVRGGTGSPDASKMPHPGLSPRARRNQRICRRAFHCPGSIAACAAEPLSRLAASVANRVYRRVRGGTNMNSTSATRY